MNILIVESRYHPAIAAALMDGATAAVEKGGAQFTRLAVPGVLELPAAIAIAWEGRQQFDGYVALGCVIGHDILHETIYRETMRGLGNLGQGGMALGNGVIIADDEAAALTLAQDGDAGGEAARASLALVLLRERLGYLT